MKTKIGILGTGRMVVRLARLFAECGSEVILGSRTPCSWVSRGVSAKRTA